MLVSALWVISCSFLDFSGAVYCTVIPMTIIRVIFYLPAPSPVLLLLFDVVVDGGGAERVRQLLRVQVFDLTVPVRQRL